MKLGINTKATADFNPRDRVSKARAFDIITVEGVKVTLLINKFIVDLSGE